MQNISIIGGGIVGAVLIGTAVWWLAFKKLKKKSTANSARLATTLRDERTRSDIILNSIEDGVVFVDE
jgi:hypothetical protein